MMSVGAHRVSRRMGAEIKVVEVEHLAVRPTRAAELLSTCEDFFRKHVLRYVAVVYVGRLRLVPVRALATWLENNAVRRVGERFRHDVPEWYRGPGGLLRELVRRGLDPGDRDTLKVAGWFMIVLDAQPVGRRRA
jgi:hypothetical protein